MVLTLPRRQALVALNPEADPRSPENSRRAFLQKVGALAATTPLAATAAAAESMPKIKLGEHSVSRLIMGCNTVGNLSHLSVMIDIEMRAWHTPERRLADFKHALEVGINCVEAPLPQWVQQVNELGVGEMLFTTRNTAPLDETIRPGRGAKEIAQGGCIAIHHGGAGPTGTDAWWRRGKLNRVREWCKPVRDAGVLVAITSHRPEVFMEIESQGWDVDYYMTCMYKYGRTPAEWEKSFEHNPGMAPAELYHSREGTSEFYGGETAFVRGDPAEMLKVVKQTKKPCMVYKILASGRLCEKQEFVERTFKHYFENIKPTDAIVVGHWTKQMDQYAINAEYVRKYGQVTPT
jgi:hypothetical protein